MICPGPISRILATLFFVSILSLVVCGCSDDESDLTIPVIVDDPWAMSLERTDWFWASAPILADNSDQRSFDPQDRVETVRWFQPKERTLRRYLNPDLTNADRDQTQPSLDLYLRAEDGSWDEEDWGGVTTSISRTGRDLSAAEFVEIWINDGVADPSQRRGQLHIDFGYINEDGFWPLDNDQNLIVGTHEQEDGILDGNPDGIFEAVEEDIGLDGNEFGPQLFDASYEISGDSPFPRINGTSRNNREDDEDLNKDYRLNRDNGYFTATINLKDTEALVDVVQDYENVDDLVANNIAWRKYRLPVAAADSVSIGTEPNLKAVTHLRVWYEDSEPGGGAVKWLQISGLKFMVDSE